MRSARSTGRPAPAVGATPMTLTSAADVAGLPMVASAVSRTYRADTPVNTAYFCDVSFAQVPVATGLPHVGAVAADVDGVLGDIPARLPSWRGR